MAEETACGERRCEPRWATTGRITWQRHGSDLTFSARLRDASSSSVSFVAATAARPLFGEEIELINANRSKQRYRVTRIASCGDDLSLIACRAAELGDRAPSGPAGPMRRPAQRHRTFLSTRAWSCILFVIAILAAALLLASIAR